MMKECISEIINRIANESFAETSFGRPVKMDKITIIPVTKTIRRKEKSSEGLPEETIQKRYPIGYMEIHEEHVRFIPLYDNLELILLGALSGIGLCLLLNWIRKGLIEPLMSKKSPSSSPENSIITLLKAMGICGSVLLSKRAIEKLKSSQAEDSLEDEPE
jgi:hypothetical protein